jgi:hypothetical protein
MRPGTKESEEQRRRRVVSRIRNELRVHVANDLVELARVGKFPDEWMRAEDVNRLLDDSGYWAGHAHVMASFLTPGACEDVVGKALDMLSCTHPDTWVRAGDQFKPATRDWNAYAAQKADLLRREYPTADRTALHTGSDGASVLFAQDDYVNDPRARDEVTLLRKFLRDSGIPELGFGTSTDGRAWVMVVWSTDEAALSHALFEAWQTAFNGAEEIKFN